MTQSIELLLDERIESAVRDEWDALTQASLPSMARHTSETNRPHVTLAVADRIPEDVDDSFSALAARVPLSIRLGSLLCFSRRPGVFILVRLVVPSVALLAVQAEAAEKIRGLPGTSGHLEPGAWTPHVTLAGNVPAGQLAIALEVLSQLPDLTGAATAVRRWDSTARRTWLVT